MLQQKLPIILGPTASGKTNLAVALADYFDGEIISADSRQVFRGMDIGTGKDLTSYNLPERQIPYHLIDIINPGDKYNVDAFKTGFYAAYENILSRGKLPILCGGTGMYVHSILQNHLLTAVPVNETLRAKLGDFSKEELIYQLEQFPESLRHQADFSSSKRLIRAIEIAQYLSDNVLPENNFPSIDAIVIGLASDVDLRRKRIIQRLNDRLSNGLIDEVNGLLNAGVGADVLTFYGLEYKFVVAYLKNELDYSTLVDRLGTAICQFAKRQMTFFRKMEKDGVKINWLSNEGSFIDLRDKAIQLIANELESK